MKIDTNTSSPGANELDSVACRRTGLSKPECHCRECLRDLMARFAPERRS